ncbi:hypothetical protein SDC9_51731 [bioreactor metagenome]|uniref:Uncharacterized protein n=1 Tax=bioreactor metagenome TaxID=1076179 RepID=A0A644WPK5_9ZZZZ
MRKNKSWVPALLALILIVSGFLIYTEASAQAPKWLGWLIPSGQDPAAPVQVQEALVPNPISAPFYPNTSDPISTSNLEIQQVIEKNNTEAITLLAPGLLHISKERQIFSSNSATFTNGELIPTFEKIDEWYQLGEGGQVIAYVSITDTGDPATTQTVVYKDKKFTNLTFPNLASTEPEDFFLKTLDFGFADIFSGEKTADLVVSQEGNETKFSITTLINNPEANSKGVNYSGIREYYSISNDTGLIRQIGRDYIDLEGNEVQAFTVQILGIERVKAFPEDISAFFE